MSVGSDPIECCVRGRFLCVCVTARRRGFRGGLLRRGSEKLLSTCFARLPGIGFAAGGDRRGLPLPVRCAFRFAARAGSSPPGLLPTTDDGRTSFVPHLGRGGGRRAALLPLFTLRRQGSLLEVFSFRQASDESADRIRQVENALHVAALSGRAAAFGGTRGRRGRTVSLDTGEIMSDEREGADAGKRAGARSGPCPQAVAADESPGVGNSAMGGKVKRRRRKPPAFRKKVTPIGLKPITF